MTLSTNSLRRWAKNIRIFNILFHLLLQFVTNLYFLERVIVKRVLDVASILVFKFLIKHPEGINKQARTVVVLISKTDSKSPHTEGFDFLHFYRPLFLFAHTHAPNVELIPWYLDGKNSIRDSFKFLMLLKLKHPESLILSSWNMSDPRLSSPSPYLLHTIRNRFHLTRKVIVLGWDTVDDGFWERHLNFDFVDEIIALDNPIKLGIQFDSDKLQNVRVESNIPPPFNLTLFNNAGISKCIFGVSFFGLVGSYRDYRKPYVSILQEMEHPSHISAGEDKFSQPSFQQMYEVLSQSKIGVSFSSSVKDRSQLKGRVWETLLSGALLLEQENVQILEFFTPNVHFVFFDSPESLAEKVDYYLSHESERAKIATAGRERAQLLQSKQELFRRLIPDFGLNVSDDLWKQ